MFDDGRKYLEANGVQEKQARTILGKWRRDFGEEAVLAALSKADRESVFEPIAFITKVLSGRAANASASPANIGARSAISGIDGA